MVERSDRMWSTVEKGMANHFSILAISFSCIPFLSFIKPIFALNVPLVSLIFLKRSLVFPILLLSSICIVRWGRLSYLSWLFFGTLHSNGNIFPFLLCLLLLFFSQLFVRPPQTTIFAFLHFFFMGMVLITASCTMSQTCIHAVFQIKPLESMSLPL